MRIIYTLFIHCYGLFIRLATLFNVKARLWVDGRRGLFANLGEALKQVDREKSPVIWFHASSLGEFEQGRPIIEAFRKAYPACKILLTFFSPSGYEVRKNYDQADWIFYLPLDTPGNARRWIGLVKPAAAIFIKYDFWFNFLGSLFRQNIPVYFVSAIFRPSQHFFRWYGGWFKSQLAGVAHFFVQNKESSMLLESIGLRNVTVSGDTRFDRVFAVASEKHSFPLIEQFISGKRVFIGGSTWKEDEALLFHLINHKELNLKFILAPHDPSPGRIQHILGQLDTKVVRYSELTAQKARTADVLIIDSVGILAQLYQYATLAFIGGGFGAGIHNIQEPITYGVPVFFGPGYHKFKEAVDLFGQGAVFSVTTADELVAKTARILADPDEYQHLSKLCRNYVDENRGATSKIMHYFEGVFR
ncbi:MAG: glycosyltransferase N-terminal domain-containing protein [Bacteroidota bacterium]